MEKACETCVHKDKPSFSATCVECGFAMMNYEHIPFTNADRIRAMTDEELAELFADDNCGYCRIHDFCFDKGSAINCEDVWLDWLKQEKDDEN